jgi:sec-independent protein translocase protein TatA
VLHPEPLDIVIIALVAMLLFGSQRLPASARSLGRAIREFKAAISGEAEPDVSQPKPAETESGRREGGT